MARFPKHKDDFNHADWLSLIDVSGPFLSVPVLRRVWPTLDALDKGTRERLRQEHAALPGRPWIDYVLTGLLGWGDAVHFTGLDALSMDVPEHDTEVTPSFALLEPGTTPGRTRRASASSASSATTGPPSGSRTRTGPRPPSTASPSSAATTTCSSGSPPTDAGGPSSGPRAAASPPLPSSMRSTGTRPPNATSSAPSCRS